MGTLLLRTHAFPGERQKQNSHPEPRWWRKPPQRCVENWLCRPVFSALVNFPWKFYNQDLITAWWWIIRTSFQNVKPLCLRWLGLFIMHRMKRVKSFQPHSGFGVSTFFESHGLLIGWYAFKRSVLKSLRFVSSAIGSSKIFCATVWSDEYASLPCRSSSTNKSYIVYSKSPLRSMRSFCVAMMHIFCPSLIVCSRSVDRAAHGPQTRQMAVFDRSQSENYVRCCRLLAASVLLPSCRLTFVLTEPRSKVCWSVASRGSQKCETFFTLVAWGRATRYRRPRT